MYNIHSWAKDALDKNIYQEASISVTLKNNQTLTLTNADIIENSLSIDRYTVTSGSIALGTGVAAELNVKLNNHDGRFNDVNFAGAKMEVHVILNVPGYIHPEDIPMGIFIVNNNPRRLSTITITALDKMTLLDKPVDRSQHTVWPKNMAGFLGDCVYQVGGIAWNPITIQYLSRDFTNTHIYIAQLPATEGILTYRQLLMWCAGIIGAVLYVNYDGALDLMWYDCGTYDDDQNEYVADYTSLPSTRYDSDIYDDEITFTGLFHKGEDKVETLVGQGDYAIDLSNNALVLETRENLNDTSADVYNLLTNLYNQLNIPWSYVMFSASVKPAPYLWPGDSVDYVKVTYEPDPDDPDEPPIEIESHCLTTLTHVNYKLNGVTTIGASGETQEEHQVAPASSGTASVPDVSANNLGVAGNASITGNLTVGGTASFGGDVAVGSGKLLKVVNVTVLSSKSIAANSYSDGTVSASALQTAIGTGWTPLGLVGVHAGGTNNVGCTATQYYIDSSGGIFMRVRNFSASASTLTMSADVLCIRTSL